MDKLIDLINQGGTGEYDARQPQERGEAVAQVKAYEDVDGDTQHAIHWLGKRLPHGTKLYAHLPAADARVAELEAQLAASDRHGVYLEELTDAQADRIAALEAQLAETKKAYRSMVDANREASEKLAASREREGRMREALTDLIGAVRHLNPCPATLEKAESLAAEKEQTK